MIKLSNEIAIIPRVASFISHLGQIYGGKSPGPFSGGTCRGYLWGDDGAKTPFTSI